LLRYTLQQQFHQDLNSLHTDAWLEHSSSAGQRARQDPVGVLPGPCRSGRTPNGWSSPPVACRGLPLKLELVACSRRTCPSVLCYFCHLHCLMSLFRQTERLIPLYNCMSGCPGSVLRAHMKQMSSDYVAFRILYSLSAYITFEGCLTYFLSEKSACYTLLWLMYAGTCRTSTSAGVQQWCCRCAWQMMGWLWRAASGMGSRMKCCAVCVSWSTPVSWPWR